MVADLSLRIRSAAACGPRLLVWATAVAGSRPLVSAAARSSRSVLPSRSELSSPDPSWLAAEIVAQAVSIVAYALIVQQLLAERGVLARIRELVRATVGGIAIGASLPGGQALSTAYWYKL